MCLKRIEKMKPLHSRLFVPFNNHYLGTFHAFITAVMWQLYFYTQLKKKLLENIWSKITQDLCFLSKAKFKRFRFGTGAAK